MIIDTSAIVAILRNEPERHKFNMAIEEAETRLISAVTFVEASIIIESRYGPDGTRALELFMSKASIEIVDVDSEQAYAARNAYRHYGKGRHRAGLNFGDCFSYALARITGEQLLFKGNDFGFTDVEMVLPS